MTFDEWSRLHPAAAADLILMLNDANCLESTTQHSEGAAQQQARFTIAKAGAMSWRNNVGATPSKCPVCNTPQQPVRYGLCNDSKKLNEKFKSSDLILAIPRLITPAMVGTTIAQFGSVEMKPPGWVFTGKGREGPQASWLALIQKLGGFATFSTGGITL